MPTAVDSFGTRWPHTGDGSAPTASASYFSTVWNHKTSEKFTVLRDFSTGSRTAAVYSFF